MNEVHLHLALNHQPIILPVAGLIVLLTGIFTRSGIVKRTAYLLFIIAAVSAAFAVYTGEGAEEIAENIPEISKNYISEHEETAETFALMSYVLGGLALLGFWTEYSRRSFSNILSYIILLFTLVVLFFAKNTGTSGGEIRHPEIRTGQKYVPADHEYEREHE